MLTQNYFYYMPRQLLLIDEFYKNQVNTAVTGSIVTIKECRYLASVEIWSQ